ncbi:hypothetical protein KR093_000809 [Drosophila rubida]|uniref:Salivary secreted peptide n=1 Tax=Drosophila rubida TaxID=30044 RepID=A0AAD4JY27_9MUSC|nr:hypothetical protein KR093_000809 [Drosophila rubida]
MKVYCLALLVLMSLAAVGLADDGKQSHSVTWGARVFRDTHLERIVISEKSRFLRVVTREYKFKQQSLKRKITQIVITDQIKDGKGGYAHLRGGGPGASFAEIHFKSQRNRGFSFIVDIYGV